MPGAGDRAAPTPLSGAPAPVAPPAEGGGGGGSSGKFDKQLNGTGTHLSGTLSGGWDDTRGAEGGSDWTSEWSRHGVGTAGTKAVEGGLCRPPGRGFPRDVGREQHQFRAGSVTA